MKQDNAAERVKALQPSTGIDKRRMLTNAEAIEIIRAYRRGVSMAQIAKAAGCNRANLYSRVGAWALREAPLPEPKRRAAQAAEGGR